MISKRGRLILEPRTQTFTSPKVSQNPHYLQATPNPRSQPLFSYCSVLISVCVEARKRTSNATSGVSQQCRQAQIGQAQGRRREIHTQLD